MSISKSKIDKLKKKIMETVLASFYADGIEIVVPSKESIIINEATFNKSAWSSAYVDTCIDIVKKYKEAEGWVDKNEASKMFDSLIFQLSSEELNEIVRISKRKNNVAIIEYSGFSKKLNNETLKKIGLVEFVKPNKKQSKEGSVEGYYLNQAGSIVANKIKDMFKARLESDVKICLSDIDEFFGDFIFIEHSSNLNDINGGFHYEKTYYDFTYNIKKSRLTRFIVNGLGIDENDKGVDEYFSDLALRVKKLKRLHSKVKSKFESFRFSTITEFIDSLKNSN